MSEDYTPGRGPYIRTFTGKKFHPLDPQPEDLDLHDIAHHLSLSCRWGGACGLFYSVAQHSIWCADMAQKITKDPEVPRMMLGHDMSEAYLCDLPRPIKTAIPEYKVVEKKIMAAIATRFGFTYPLTEMGVMIDDTALVAERMGLFPKDKWFLEEDYSDYEKLYDTASNLVWEVQFLQRWDEDRRRYEFLRLCRAHNIK